MNSKISNDLSVINEIEKLRKVLVATGAKKGLDHPHTIALSQKLDLLLNKFKNELK